MEYTDSRWKNAQTYTHQCSRSIPAWLFNESLEAKSQKWTVSFSVNSPLLESKHLIQIISDTTIESMEKSVSFELYGRYQTHSGNLKQ